MINCGKISIPAHEKDLARFLVDMVETEKYGYYYGIMKAATSVELAKLKCTNVSRRKRKQSYHY